MFLILISLNINFPTIEAQYIFTINLIFSNKIHKSTKLPSLEYFQPSWGVGKI